ncbi:MAG: hypothetical protein JXB05_31925 [Myxococcaceae bacterium]|nr:hypothetical protein [Myxococcaceae bacterium]
MSTDQKGPRILARTFFAQLRSSGYTPHQIIGIATELLDLVTEELKQGDKAEAGSSGSDVSQVTNESAPGWQPRV